MSGPGPSQNLAAAKQHLQEAMGSRLFPPGSAMGNLAQAIEEIIKHIENPPCCAGGPQWGHDWNCGEGA